MEDFATEVQQILKQTNSAVETALTDTLKKVAKETVQDLKGTSPRRTGKYRSGWAVKEVSRGSYVVYNKIYQLTHLLEKGHKTRYKSGKYGSRSFVPAQSHIAEAEARMKEKLEPELQKQVEVQIKKI